MADDWPDIDALHDFLMESSDSNGDQFMVAAKTLRYQDEKIRSMRSKLGDIKIALGDIMIESYN